MLNKFEEQYLLASVERLEDIKNRLDNPNNNSNDYFLMVDIKDIKKDIDKTISDIKSIKPRLFSYPKVARYLSGKYDPTITE